MRNRVSFFAIWRAAFFAIAAFPAFAQGMSLPQRTSPQPETTNGVPHVQIGVQADPEIKAELLRSVAEFPGVSLGPTRVSLPGAVGFQLDADVTLARPGSIVGGREFAHLHPDGSLHASLDPVIARKAVAMGWAIAHPWAQQRQGWEGFVMIYTPNTKEELGTVIQLVQSSYIYITGQTFPK